MKLTKAQTDAIRYFQKKESNIQKVHLRDMAVTLVVASWPYMTVEVLPGAGKPPTNDVDKWRWLWKYVRFDIVELAFITGLGDRCAPAMARARGNRLIYPNGTINKVIEKRLKKLNKG